MTLTGDQEVRRTITGGQETKRKITGDQEIKRRITGDQEIKRSNCVRVESVRGVRYVAGGSQRIISLCGPF
jgi:hypothetical protein